MSKLKVPYVRDVINQYLSEEITLSRATEMLNDAKSETEFSRRNRLDLNTKAELAIFNAIQEVEKIGADERLTKAVVMLSDAKDLVSDFVDEKG